MSAEVPSIAAGRFNYILRDYLLALLRSPPSNHESISFQENNAAAMITATNNTVCPGHDGAKSRAYIAKCTGLIGAELDR